MRSTIFSVLTALAASVELGLILILLVTAETGVSSIYWWGICFTTLLLVPFFFSAFPYLLAVSRPKSDWEREEEREKREKEALWWRLYQQIMKESDPFKQSELLIRLVRVKAELEWLRRR